MNSHFPKLRVIPINKLILHEKEEPKRVENLIKKVKLDGYFKNPVIVVKLDFVKELDRNDGNFLVLDGVHRVKALEKLGCFAIVAQVVDYFDKNIKVCTWDRLLFGSKKKELLERIRKAGEFDLIKTKERIPSNLLRREKFIGELLFRDGEIFLIRSNKKKTGKLLGLMELCGKVSEMKRVLKSDVPLLFKKHGDAVAALVIPNYNKKEIIKVAKKGEVLPAGVTRHIIPNRVLGLDISLSMLKGNSSLKRKNELLENFIDQRRKEGRIRFYSESVFVFDE